LSNAISLIRQGAENDTGSMQMSSLFWADSQFTGSRMNLFLGTNPAVTTAYAGNFGSKFLTIGAADGGSTTWAMQGNISELFVFPTNLPEATRKALYGNQESYYGW
jgi:hypothetical protein